MVQESTRVIAYCSSRDQHSSIVWIVSSCLELGNAGTPGDSDQNCDFREIRAPVGESKLKTHE